MSALQQVLQKWNIRKIIEKKQGDRKCKMCSERVETVLHIASKCDKLW